jgi:hypothetical protein
MYDICKKGKKKKKKERKAAYADFILKITYFINI